MSLLRTESADSPCCRSPTAKSKSSCVAFRTPLMGWLMAGRSSSFRVMDLRHYNQDRLFFEGLCCRRPQFIGIALDACEMFIKREGCIGVHEIDPIPDQRPKVG